jgi:hypothetical protein
VNPLPVIVKVVPGGPLNGLTARAGLTCIVVVVLIDVDVDEIELLVEVVVEIDEVVVEIDEDVVEMELVEIVVEPPPMLVVDEELDDGIDDELDDEVDDEAAVVVDGGSALPGAATGETSGVAPPQVLT